MSFGLLSARSDLLFPSLNLSLPVRDVLLGALGLEGLTVAPPEGGLAVGVDVAAQLLGGRQSVRGVELNVFPALTAAGVTELKLQRQRERDSFLSDASLNNLHVPLPFFFFQAYHDVLLIDSLGKLVGLGADGVSDGPQALLVKHVDGAGVQGGVVGLEHLKQHLKCKQSNWLPCFHCLSRPNISQFQWDNVSELLINIFAQL